MIVPSHIGQRPGQDGHRRFFYLDAAFANDVDAGDVVKAVGVPLEPLEGVVAVRNDDADGFVT